MRCLAPAVRAELQPRRRSLFVAGAAREWLVGTRVGQERFTALRLGPDGYDRGTCTRPAATWYRSRLHQVAWRHERPGIPCLAFGADVTAGRCAASVEPR